MRTKIENIIANLQVPYNNYGVLTTPSDELDIVNYYFVDL